MVGTRRLAVWATAQMATRAAGKSRALVVVLAGNNSLFQWGAVAMCERAKQEGSHCLCKVSCGGDSH
jgi:hypothetical protein